MGMVDVALVLNLVSFAQCSIILGMGSYQALHRELCLVIFILIMLHSNLNHFIDVILGVIFCYLIPSMAATKILILAFLLL